MRDCRCRTEMRQEGCKMPTKLYLMTVRRRQRNGTHVKRSCTIISDAIFIISGFIVYGSSQCRPESRLKVGRLARRNLNRGVHDRYRMHRTRNELCFTVSVVESEGYLTRLKFIDDRSNIYGSLCRSSITLHRL